jgi:flagellar hook assembly protein FlgD
MLVSEIDTQFVTIAVDEGLYSGIGNPGTSGMNTLSANYPNPFTSATTIEYATTQTSPVSIEVYDICGQKVRTLVDAAIQAGNYSVIWDGTDDSGNVLPGGIYLYRMKSENATMTKRCLLLR